jgi:hypothetical protein
MNVHLKQMLARAEKWSDADQEELAQAALEIESRRRVYHATPDELRAIDEGLAAVARGDIATEAEAEAVFAKFRRA